MPVLTESQELVNPPPPPGVPESPELPTEVWEHVIDLVDGESDERVRAASLTACCLVCHDWLPRAQHNLGSSWVSEETVIRSRFHLNRVLRTLAIAPKLGNRVRSLTIVGDVEDSVWSSAAVLSLGPRFKRLEVLTFRQLDFSARHPTFFKACAFFAPLKRLVLDRVDLLSLADITHLAYVTQSAAIRVQWGKTSHPLLHVLRPERPPFVLHQVEHLVIKGTPWSEMRIRCKEWRLQLPKMRNLKFFRLETQWPGDSESYVPTAVDMVAWRSLALLARTLTELASASTKLAIDTEIVNITVGTMQPSRLRYLDIGLTVNDFEDARLAVLPVILSSLSFCEPTDLHISVLAAEIEGIALPSSLLSSANLLQSWENIDDELMRPMYSTLRSGRISFRDMTGLGTHERLSEVLLPQWVKKQQITRMELK
ncbi:hypothetical protein EIP91_005184 [Steccherinum ochraceum]|uniref:F-box domain-containing protein n=1 Tax=Steccherinum ochraceum TaxID=92696 RepID=A0A4R0RDL4_9APHY|nr:hypothetical protein EIP91_005184 [Steccherinum ochraceum]